MVHRSGWMVGFAIGTIVVLAQPGSGVVCGQPGSFRGRDILPDQPPGFGWKKYGEYPTYDEAKAQVDDLKSRRLKAEVRKGGSPPKPWQVWYRPEPLRERPPNFPPQGP